MNAVAGESSGREVPTGTFAKLGGVVTGIALGAALIAYYIVSYLMVMPPAVAASGTSGNASLTLQTVASLGFGPHPDWVSYLVKNPQGQWVHSTVLEVPANSLVHVTILQYDTATGLRNPFWGQPQGIIGRARVNGKPIPMAGYRAAMPANQKMI